ncbi:MAG: histone deacetylase [bacterium]|nr:histone deacetylase [bacterium]
MARTGLLFLEEGLNHDAGAYHPESPKRLEALRPVFEEVRDRVTVLEPARATRDDLLRVHSDIHIDLIDETCRSDKVYPDPDTKMGPGSWDAAWMAAGSVIAACKAVLDGAVANAFCAVRPPGHHAERDRAMGFCLFNNVAIGARWLREKAKLGKVAILDWDVHHGNGTQQAFYEDSAVFVASIHQSPLFPGTGRADERGAADTNLNVPMAPGSGPGEWMAAMDDTVLPAIQRFKPDFLLISCGFDGHRLDPLAAQELHSDTYGEFTRRVADVAGGRIVSVLEGGYHPKALAESARAHIAELMTMAETQGDAR